MWSLNTNESTSINSIRYNILKIDPNDEEDNSKEKKNIENNLTIIIGSTNFYFIFNDNRETIPVLLLFQGKNILYGNKVIEIISKHKYLNKAMFFFDFLYYLDKKYGDLLDILIKRNLMNNDFNFLKDNKDKTITFKYCYLSSQKVKKERKNLNIKIENGNQKKDSVNKVILPSIENQKLYTYQNNKIIIQHKYTSEELLNIYIENLIKDKLSNLKHKINLKLIFPPYLNEKQKIIIENIFYNKLGKNNLKKFIIKDEIDYYLENLNKKFENKIIFIHFGGSSLVVFLCNFYNEKNNKKKKKLIGGIDIDITLTKDSFNKFTIDHKIKHEIKITDNTLIYKVKNLIEEEKKKLYSNNNDILEINIDSFKFDLPLNYKISKEYIIKDDEIENIINDFKNILKQILENENKDEIENVIYTGNNFKFREFEEILFEYFSKDICISIFDEELKF